MAAVKPGIESLVAAAAADPGLLLLFDFDGTLSPTVARPEQARLPVPTRHALLDLAAAGCRLGVLSGRSLADLRSLVDVPGVWLAGSGGLELWVEGRIRGKRDHAGAALLLASHAREIADVVTWLPGAWLERKPFGLTIHHAGASPATVAAVRELAADLENRAADVRVVVCTLGVEITACPDIHKGTAVAGFIAAAGGSVSGLLYAGNEANDAEAMVEVARRCGWVIGVGQAAPPAHDRVSSPEELQRVLAGLAVALQSAARGRRSPGSLP